MTLSRPVPDPIRCRPLTAADADPATRQMTAAFEHDPGMGFVFPESPRRSVRLRWLMRACLRLGQIYGNIRIVDPAPAGTAIWFAPGRGEPSAFRLLRGGWAAAPFRLGWQTLLRLLRLTQAIEHERHRVAPGPHWYLLSLSIAPDRHGQGLGSALLDSVIEAAGSENPGYLETFNPANLPFYERHGFRTVCESRRLKGGPPFWCLLRPAPG